MATILIDLDAVLADFIGGIVKIYNSRCFASDHISTPMFKTYKFENCFTPEVASRVLAIFHEPNFFLNLEPTPHAIATVRKILEIGHTIEICTAPPRIHCPKAVEEKLEWVAKVFPELSGRVTVTSNKHNLMADMLIDDYSKNLLGWCPKNPNGVGYLVNVVWNESWTELPSNAVRGNLDQAIPFIEHFWDSHQKKFVYRTSEIQPWRV